MAKARKTIGLTYNDLISPVFIVLQYETYFFGFTIDLIKSL